MRHYIFVRPKSVRPNVRPNDRRVRPTTVYVRPNGHVNVRTYDQTGYMQPTKNTHSVFYSENPVVIGEFQVFGWTFNEETHTHNNSSF